MTAHYEDIEKQRETGHGHHHKSRDRQDRAAMDVDDQRARRQNRELVGHDTYSTSPLLHVREGKNPWCKTIWLLITSNNIRSIRYD